jgi:hypothetical protein
MLQPLATATATAKSIASAKAKATLTATSMNSLKFLLVEAGTESALHKACACNVGLSAFGI